LERVLQFQVVRLSPADAEALQIRLLWLAEYLPPMRAAFWGEQQG